MDDLTVDGLYKWGFFISHCFWFNTYGANLLMLGSRQQRRLFNHLRMVLTFTTSIIRNCGISSLPTDSALIWIPINTLPCHRMTDLYWNDNVIVVNLKK